MGWGQNLQMPLKKKKKKKNNAIVPEIIKQWVNSDFYTNIIRKHDLYQL